MSSGRFVAGVEGAALRTIGLKKFQGIEIHSTVFIDFFR